ncbi:putative nuclear migration protein [Erysiphe necator]|uniref:Putative nuclear migration protein n=1 Tax=Uncinula necator TaxID=52586 RepID=A0A0B1PBM7_UNCNE|nr:putative nuclear migration protein [Erysiphe necator]
MTAWDTEDEYAAAVPKSLPSPSDSSYSGRVKICLRSNSSRPVSPSIDRQEPSIDLDSIKNNFSSTFDPRILNPTLHANLVSEILTLRRALEAKKKQIESLETTLYETRGEHEIFSAGLTSISKENHSLKRKLELVEAGTSTALSELSKDREIARELAQEAKRRLEKAQKKIRSQDGEIDRVHALWARDKSSWEEEKRIIERRVHVAENRLKKILEEVAIYGINKTNKEYAEDKNNLDVELQEKPESDTESIRTRSLTSSVRFSISSGLARHGEYKTDGLSLADELNLDEKIELSDDSDYESVHSTSLSNHGRESRAESLGLTDQTNVCNKCSSRPCSPTQGRVSIKTLDSKISGEDNNGGAKNLEHLDSGNKISRSLSATSELQENVSLSPKEVLISEGHELRNNYLANLSLQDNSNSHEKKNRVHSNFSISVQCCSISPADHLSQEVPDLQETFTLPYRDYLLSLGAEERIEMKSKSIQTDEFALTSFKSIPPPVLIPSIHLHPPLSTPATPNQYSLPQQFKDKACQVSFLPNVKLKSTSMQTEEIRIDKRLNVLSLKIEPPMIFLKSKSAENSKALCTQTSLLEDSGTNCLKLPGSGNKIISDQSKNEDAKTYEIECSKENLDVTLDKNISPTLDSNIVGAEKINSENEFTDRDLSDLPRSSLSQPQRREKQNDLEQSTQRENLLFTNDTEKNIRVESSDLELSGNLSNPDELKTRINQIWSKTEVRHEQSCASISSMTTNEPPFPIPTRLSSRRPYLTLSLLSDCTKFPSLAQKRSFHRRSRSVHKVRSATTLSRAQGSSPGGNVKRNINGTPPLTLSPTSARQNSLKPYLNSSESFEHIYSMASSYKKSHIHTMAKNICNSDRIDSSSLDRTTSVISAIACGMIGEWVYKYVRHRGPIGVSESAEQPDNSKKVRHKRWVWLAPYDRAVMWSSKEPTSGTALLGKNGRKIIVQTVLDVKDENPAPKGVNLFHRSILILSPARALKFTATTMERHFNWLMALSFLAHSQQLPQPISPLTNSLDSKSQSQYQLREASTGDSVPAAIEMLNFTSKSSTGHNQSSQFISEVNPRMASEANYVIEDVNSAADAPIVPRYTDRSVSHITNTTTANYFSPLYHRKRSNTSPRNVATSSHKSSRPRLYSSKASKSTVVISTVPFENNDIKACKSRTIPTMNVHTSSANSNFHSYANMKNHGKINSANSEASMSTNCNDFETGGTVRMQAFISMRNSFAASETEGHQIGSEELKCQNIINFEENRFLSQEFNTKTDNNAESVDACIQENDLVTGCNQDKYQAHDRSDDLSPFPCL